MKKENIKLLLTFIITAFIFLSLGVYATSTFLAKDISFTSTNPKFEANNVEDALNTLYTYKDKKVSKNNFVGNGTSTDVLTDSFYSNYTYLKVTNIFIYSGTKCDVFFQTDNGTVEQNVVLNQEYNIKNMISAGYPKFSTRNTNGYCWPTVEYYN